MFFRKTKTSEPTSLTLEENDVLSRYQAKYKQKQNQNPYEMYAPDNFVLWGTHETDFHTVQLMVHAPIHYHSQIDSVIRPLCQGDHLGIQMALSYSVSRYHEQMEHLKDYAKNYVQCYEHKFQGPLEELYIDYHPTFIHIFIKEHTNIPNMDIEILRTISKKRPEIDIFEREGYAFDTFQEDRRKEEQETRQQEKAKKKFLKNSYTDDWSAKVASYAYEAVENGWADKVFLVEEPYTSPTFATTMQSIFTEIHEHLDCLSRQMQEEHERD